MSLKKAKVWKTLVFGMGGKQFLSSKTNNELFLKGNFLRVLNSEGWFDLLQAPHSFEEIAKKFGYSNLDLLKEILEFLSGSEQILKSTINEKGIKYYSNGPKLSPGLDISKNYLKYAELNKFYGPGLRDVWINHANFIPDLLRGKKSGIMSLKSAFSEGTNLYDWDENLGMKIFSILLDSAFTYARKEFNKADKILHAGCYNGVTTGGLLLKLLQENQPQNQIPEIIGIHPNQDLLRIAQEEFSRVVRETYQKDVTNYTDFYPKFKYGSVEQIPFDDNSFDVVYTSQVFQWVNIPKALKEMIRVTKSGGIVVGDITFRSVVTNYYHFLFKVVEGATGFPTKEQFLEWVNELNVSNVELASIATIFKIRK